MSSRKEDSAITRLISGAPFQATPIAQPQDTRLQSNYVQTYQHDAIGDILRMKQVSSVAWERGYDYSANGNRLHATSDTSDDVDDPANDCIE